MGCLKLTYQKNNLEVNKNYFKKDLSLKESKNKSYSSYLFGQAMPGRVFDKNSYRFNFQGQEEDEETGFVNYKYRMHDPRLGRFLSIDPLSLDYPWNSPYAFSENRVIDGIELEGLEFYGMTTPIYGTTEIMMSSSSEIMLSNSEVLMANSPKRIGIGEILRKGIGRIKGNFDVRLSRSSMGKPGLWDHLKTAAENFAKWKEIGRVGHDETTELPEFEYEYTNKGYPGIRGRPDGYNIDHGAKTIEIGEIKGFTRTGIAKGLQDLANYSADFQKLFPDYSISNELWLYRVVLPPTYYTVIKGDNLWDISNKTNVSLEQIYKLNPNLNEKSIIHKGDVILMSPPVVEETH